MSTDGHDRRHLGAAKGRTRALDNVLQFRQGHLIVLHELANDLNGKIGKAQGTPGFQFSGRDRGDFVRHKKAAIVCQSLHHNPAEIQILLASAGAAVGDRHDFVVFRLRRKGDRRQRRRRRGRMLLLLVEP
jgi:hypothetical protein